MLTFKYFDVSRHFEADFKTFFKKVELKPWLVTLFEALTKKIKFIFTSFLEQKYIWCHDFKVKNNNSV